MNPKKMNHHQSDSSILNLVCNLLEQEENSTSPVVPSLDGDKEIDNIEKLGTVQKK